MTTWNRGKQRLTFFLMLCVLVCPFILRYMGEGVLLSSSIGIALICIFLLLSTAINSNIVVKRRDWLIFIIAIILLLMSLLKNRSFGVVITYLNMCMFLILLNNLSFTLRQVQIIRVLTIVLLGALISTFRFRWKYGVLWVYDGYDNINLNTYGILLLVLYFNVVSLIGLLVKKRWLRDVAFVVATVVALYYIWQTECRSAIISILFLVGIMFIERVNYKKILFLLVLAGALVPIIYISSYEVLGDFQFLGKSLYTGREVVWLHTWEIIKNAPILGSGTSESLVISIGEITDSAHNIYLAFWKTVGLAPTLLFVWCLLNGRHVDEMTPHNVLSKKAFLACMVVSLVETLLNDANYNFLFMMLLMEVDENSAVKRRFF
ncbi:MAG: O-antigen ligase family protein [Clostridia bacterium]|nr:O-antigen ligase family protein [Clostridia bacterium]